MNSIVESYFSLKRESVALGTFHKIKDEVFYLQSGKMIVKYSDEDDLEDAQELVLNAGDNFHIYTGLRHQMIALETLSYLSFQHNILIVTATGLLREINALYC